MKKNKIKLYSTETFRDSYMQPEKVLDEMLKPDFGKFFITKVEDMIRLIKLPVPPVRSSTHTFIYLTYGSASMNIGSERFTIFKNECLFVPAGQVFSFSDADDNKGFLCNFHNDFILSRAGTTELLKKFEFLNVWGNPCIKPGTDAAKCVNFLLKRIFSEYMQSGLSQTDIIHSYFLAALCEINAVYAPLFGNKQAQSITVTNKFKELLFQHLRTKHRVVEYAALLHISPNHLNKIVKNVTGKSPSKWIDEALMLEAKVLLYQTTLPVSDIAAELGIEDQSYFSRLFKKYEGRSPLEFRKMIEKS